MSDKYHRTMQSADELGELSMSDKYHRTMQSAFGPYTSNQIDEDSDPAEVWTFWLAVGTTVLLATLIVWLLIC